MPRLQIILLAVAFASIFGLYLLPKVVVNNPEEAPTTTSNQPSSPENDSSLSENHSVRLSESQEQKLKTLKNTYNNSKNREEKANFADSIAALFAEVNHFDSVAYYKGQAADLLPEAERLEAAGEAYLEAFRFALNEEKMKALGNLTRAYFEKVLAKQPDNQEAKAKIAVTYTQPMGNPNTMKGVQMLLDVVRQDPKQEFALLTLGTLAMYRNDYQKASERFEQILEVNPEQQEAKFYLANCYQNMGKKAEAKAALQEILDYQAPQKSLEDSLVKSAARDALKQLQ